MKSTIFFACTILVLGTSGVFSRSITEEKEVNESLISNENQPIGVFRITRSESEADLEVAEDRYKKRNRHYGGGGHSRGIRKSRSISNDDLRAEEYRYKKRGKHYGGGGHSRGIRKGR